MRIFAIAVLFIMPFALSGGEPPQLTLAEKIAMAKKMADDAAQGKAETGRVVTGDFNFGDELAKFRASSPESAPVSQNADLTESKAEIPEARPVEKPAAFEVKAPPIPAEKAAAALVQSAPAQADKITNTGVLPKVLPPPPKDGKPSAAVKHQVDTSKDFINGYYIGGMDKASQEVFKKAVREITDKRRLSYESSLFVIDSDNSDAMSAAIMFVKACDDIFAAYFDCNSLRPSDKIVLQIFSKPDGKSPFTISIDNQGAISVGALWGKSLDFNGFCKLLTGAVLRRMSISGRGLSASNSVPYWMELAFAQTLAQNVSLGVVKHLARISSENPPADLKAVFAYSRADGVSQDVKEANSFWTLKSLERAAPNGKVFTEFLRGTLSAKSPETAVALVEKNIKPRGYALDLWWRALFTGEVWARMGGVNIPDWTESEVVRLSVLQVADKNGERVGIADDEIWKNRESAAADIEQRILEIKTVLAKSNPLFHNSLVTLGEMYEACHNGDEKAFKSAHDAFLREFAEAKALSARAKKLLSQQTAAHIDVQMESSAASDKQHGEAPKGVDSKK